jgi:hypothetical protein
MVTETIVIRYDVCQDAINISKITPVFNRLEAWQYIVMWLEPRSDTLPMPDTDDRSLWVEAPLGSVYDGPEYLYEEYYH